MQAIGAYIGGALTGIPEAELQKLREFYDRIGEICQRILGLPSYVPHRYGDPLIMSKLSPEEIDQMDRTAVTRCKVMVSYVGLPSLGVGIEIEIANHAYKPTILIFKRGTKISRLALGNPGVKYCIEFSDEEDLEAQLLVAMSQIRHEYEELPAPLQL